MACCTNQIVQVFNMEASKHKLILFLKIIIIITNIVINIVLFKMIILTPMLIYIVLFVIC